MAESLLSQLEAAVDELSVSDQLRLVAGSQAEGGLEGAKAFVSESMRFTSASDSMQGKDRRATGALERREKFGARR